MSILSRLILPVLDDGEIKMTEYDLPSGGTSSGDPFVECSTARNVVDKVVALSGFTLNTGDIIRIRFTDTGTANPSSGNLTLNVNGTGAKSIVDGKSNKSVLTYSSGGWFYNNMVHEFMYDGTYWVWMTRDNNTTYTNMTLGNGYGTCSTAAATAAKVVTLANYNLLLGGIVSVYFTYAVPANATLNINSKGAKAIRYKNAALTANVITAGSVGTFIYDGTYYRLISVDKNDYVSGTTLYLV